MLAVSAWFDEVAEVAVRDLWRKLADGDIDDSLHRGPYRPHITLGIWAAASIDEVSDRVGALSSELSPLPVTFRAIGLFPGAAPGAEAVGIYLTPTVTPLLSGLHEKIHFLMGGLGRSPLPRHLPGRWEPHCTVIPTLPASRTASAIAALLEAALLPLDATVNRIGLIETPAEIELASFPLG